ncbi:MAG TPA: ABC transporter ATP-binding protein [Patescibacteria group bacterium]|nr:ABC transporter ATP-binding protein [Patescibacteria group bacterium]
MPAVIKLTGVTKKYGSIIGVQDINLEVEKGLVFGFIGPNGAGKTTTISMLVDLIRPTNGQINIFGLDSTRDSVEIRKRIGFLAGDFSLDENLTGQQQLEYFANLRGGVDQARIKKLAHNLDSSLNRKIKTLSRGNRQKLGLISALMHDPELLIFDEPTSGLDPLIQAKFNSIILEHKRAGKTVFISSHLLSEVQEVCDKVAFIRDGQIFSVESLKDMANKSPKHVHVISKDKGLQSALEKLDGVKILAVRGQVLDFTYGGSIEPLLKLLTVHKVSDLSIQETDLETIFMEYYKSKGEDSV